MLAELGYFAREMEWADRNAGDVQTWMKRQAAERLYERLLDPPYPANVVPLPIRGVAAFATIDGARS
jgi:hypothetical protein